jgi:hypothetical protein
VGNPEGNVEAEGSIGEPFARKNKDCGTWSQEWDE